MIKKKYIKKSLMGLFIMASAVLITSQTVNAAPLKKEPVKLVQPNGDVLKCFTSGDEFFNYYHDAKGQLIIKNPRTGYYGYGKYTDKKFIPSPQSAKTNFNSNDKEIKVTDINIPKDKIDSERKLLELKQPVNAKNSGTLNNIVIFIRFSDQKEFDTGLDTYNSMFNDKKAGANSMYNYYKETSYNKLNINTTFYPKASGNKVISYKDVNPRSYYVTYKPEERIAKEQDLLRRAITSVKDQIPSDLNVDNNDDGFVDNVCFVVEGATEGWSSLLWPHMWELYGKEATINNKKVKTYNFQLNNHLTTSGVGVICHEMFHSLGAPDLYHYSYDGKSPTGKWDIMEQTSNPPQYMGAHMKKRYGNWISNIPEIKSNGTYSMNSLLSSNNNCYIIKSPKSSTEYFMVEYRKASGTFESNLINSGILVYRINTKFRGNASNNDEVYILRPKTATGDEGDVDEAYFDGTSGRECVGGVDNPMTFLDGTESNIKIKNIKINDGKATFDVDFSGNTDDNNKELPFKGEIQSIKDGDTLTGNTKISGWYVYGKDLSKVEVLVNGKVVGTAKLSSNPALADKYSGYPLDRAQFTYDLDTRRISKGKCNITVKATGTDGKEDTLKEISVVIGDKGGTDEKLGFKGELETLKDGETVSGIKEIKGWFLYGKNIEMADVFVDRKPVGYANLSSKPELESKYPGYPVDKAQFTYKLDTSKLSKGQHSFIIRAVGTDRKTYIIEKNFSIGNNTDTTTTTTTDKNGFDGQLESIKNGDTVRGIINLKGWTSYNKELGMVDIIVDRRPIALADLNGQNGNKKQFEGKIDTRTLSNGEHKLLIRSIGTDRNYGIISEITINVAN